MNIRKQFEDIIKNNTREGFHDAGLVELIISAELKEIIIKIEHWKNGDNEKEEKIFIGTFKFKDIVNIHLENAVNCFGVDEEIYSLELSENNQEFFFILTGIKGWKFSFSAASFEYNEILKGIYYKK